MTVKSFKKKCEIVHVMSHICVPTICSPPPPVGVLPCLFQRCPLIEREVTAFREILEEVGVISTWILRAPSLLLLFSAAPCSDDLIALPTWGSEEKHTSTNITASEDTRASHWIDQWLSASEELDDLSDR